MFEKSLRNAIIFIGNTGVGKSYICNKIFEVCGSSTRFVSHDSNLSVSQSLQYCSIHYEGKNLTVIDSPGFFDTPGNDGINMCKLVKAIESCEDIYAIVYVYTGRFSTSHKVWFDRMADFITDVNKKNVILLHNKLGPYNVDSFAMNKVEVNQFFGGGNKQEYVWFSYKAEDNQIVTLLNTLIKFTTFQLSNLIVPEVCYERKEESAPQTENSDQIVDEGHYEEKIHYETRIKWDRHNPLEAFGIEGSGAKKKMNIPVKTHVIEKIWVPKLVTHRTIETYVNVYNVRFDGSRDLVEKKSINKEH